MSKTIEDRHLNARDKLLRDSFTPAESFLSWVLCISAIVVFCVPQPRSYWILGFLLITGALTPVILKTHESTHPFFVDFLWPKFWMLSAPIWLFLLQFLIGLTNQPFQHIELEGQSYQALAATKSWLPTTTAPESSWLPFLGFASMYLLSTNLYIIPKSRAFFEKSLPILCASAVALAVLGFVQFAIGANRSILTMGTGQLDFFGLFPYDGHWAAFASLWMACCVSISLLHLRYDDAPQFTQSVAPWYLTGAVLLGSSGLLVDARWPSALLLGSFGCMLLVFAANFRTFTQQNYRRSITTVVALAGIASITIAFLRWSTLAPTTADITLLQSSAKHIFLERPLFGWGVESYAHISPYFQSDLLEATNHQRAHSDALQALGEFGLFGAFLFPILCLYLVLRYLLGKHDIRLCNHLIYGCTSVVILSMVDTPFMSPAVYFSFFILFFSALRWSDLSRSRVDEVDARIAVVTDDRLRKVPVYSGPQNETFK